MTKLYTVTVEYEYVIAVEDDEDDWDVARRVFTDVKYDMCESNVDIHSYPLHQIPSGWDGECYPYRSSGSEKTINQIMKENDQ